MLATVLGDMGNDAVPVHQEKGVVTRALRRSGAVAVGTGWRNRALKALLGPLVLVPRQNIDLHFLYIEERWET